MDPDASSSVKRNRSVQRTAKLLKALGVAQRGLTLAELSRTAELSESTVYRLLATLQEEGLVERAVAGNGRYRLGLEVFRLGNAALNGRGLGREIMPYVEALADESGETVNVGVLHGFNVLYVQKIESQQPLRASLTVGSAIVPAHCSANGKVLLAHLGADRLERLLDAFPLTRRGLHAITDREALQRELARTREQGYAVDDREFADDIRAVAAPICDHQAVVSAAIAVAGPATRLSLERLHQLAPRVVWTAGRISAQLGYQGIDVSTEYEADGLPLRETKGVSA